MGELVGKCDVKTMIEEKYGDNPHYVDPNIILIGEHMTIVTYRNPLLQWKRLSDGFVVKTLQKIGEIHFDRNIPFIKRNEAVVGFVRTLFSSFQEELTELAFLCRENDKRLKRVQSFFGLSHIAGPLARRLGFDVSAIRNPLTRYEVTASNKQLISEIVSYHPSWTMFEKNFKPAQRAYISRNKLVQLYG